MSKIKKSIFIIVIVMFAAIIGGNFNQNTLRLETCTAISQHEFIDQNGDIWAVYDDLDNRDYSVLFDDNGTEDITDDIIRGFF